MTILDGMFTGLVLGLLISVPAFLSEFFEPKANLPILVDVKQILGRSLPHEKVLWWSMGFHLTLSVAFGGLFPLIQEFGVFPSFSFAWILLYSFAFYLLFGLVVSPALGIGYFANREGRLVWLELLFSHALLAVGFWYAATYLLRI